MVELHFYTRPNCPLCDRLGELLETDLPAGVLLTPRNILEDRLWYEQYWDRIPVVTLGDAVILEGNPADDAVTDAIDRLRDAIV